ncbi:gamma-glutamylcyclotransferase family protein [Marinobacter confluentis]|uniref:Gamma-glutamylcyclotransferase family protein n=1 Tax=Marinobacter confluentis TaxID=1697557 RepID=A0A4Z1BM90_9GAMM|nr:gamma-glutamylcyclotransferase family protein [Marinobacter confluentis]TGN41187.1 gamma-glutamylcyclotransferase [Marinobacter confluentis]
MTQRVAVYGTLKQGQSNHHILADSPLVGRCQLKQITLYDIGPYPGAKLRSSGGIDIEVYDVTDEIFAALDELEGYIPHAPKTGHYDRCRLETPFGLVWVYVYNLDVSGLREIRCGGWVAR